jgi:hypothetical protein
MSFGLAIDEIKLLAAVSFRQEDGGLIVAKGAGPIDWFPFRIVDENFSDACFHFYLVYFRGRSRPSPTLANSVAT